MSRVIVDTDPGIDDALALLLALASPEIQFEAITTVSGNVDVDQTTRNALTLLTLVGRTDVPVASGCGSPLVGEPLHASHVHGSNGLGEVILPPPVIQPVQRHAVDLIIESVLAHPGEITLVALGPLTNLALAVRREPRIASLVQEVVAMGGALRVPGNVQPSGEFNIVADPHAAHIVFHAGWPLRLVSLDTTTRTLLCRAEIDALAERGGAVLPVLRQMLSYYLDVFAAAQERTGFQMHDPLCLASVLQPDFITWEPVYVDVELHGTLTRGETVAFFQRQDMPAPNLRASVAVDSERFIRFFLARMEQCYGPPHF